MRFALKVALVLAVIVGAGCYVTSLHPLFEKADMMAEPAFLGTWTDEKGEISFTFAEGEEKLYDLAATQRENVEAKPGEPAHLREKSSQFKACLGSIGKYLYLDMCPVTPEDDPHVNLFYAVQMVGAHAIMRVETVEGKLHVSPMKLDWFDGQKEEDRPAEIPFERIGGEPFGDEKQDKRIVLTGSTAQLQAFLKKHENDEGLFGDPIVLHRQPAK